MPLSILFRFLPALCRAGVVMTAAAAATAPAGAQTVVNGVSLTAGQTQQITQATGQSPLPGRYWYDARSGLWGAEGAGAAGITRPGLEVGAPLAADASRSRTGVFINGREIHAVEVRWLQSLGPVWPGRYWLDAWGNVGLEGQPLPFANLPALVAQAGRRGASGSSTTPGGAWVASDGGCVIVQGRSSGGIGSFGASSC